MNKVKEWLKESWKELKGTRRNEDRVAVLSIGRNLAGPLLTTIAALLLATITFILFPEQWDSLRVTREIREKTESVTRGLNQMGTGNMYLGLFITWVAVVTFRVSLIVWRLTMSLTQYFREKTEKLRKRNEERGKAQGREEIQGEWTAWYQREVTAGHIDSTTIAPPPGQADRADRADFPGREVAWPRHPQPGGTPPYRLRQNAGTGKRAGVFLWPKPGRSRRTGNRKHPRARNPGGGHAE